MRFNKKYIIYIASLLLLPALVSCVNDALEECIDTPLPSDDDSWGNMPEGKYLMGFRLKFSDDYTRADGDLEGGTHEDHQVKVGSLYACFFNSEGKLVTFTDLRMYHYDKDGNEFNDGDKREGMFYASYQVKRSQVKPASCLLLLNANSEINKKFSNSSLTLDEAIKEVWEDNNDPRNIGHTAEGYQYITMTNSTYSASDGTISCVIPVTKENFVLEEELEEAGVNPYENWEGTKFEDKIVVVPVERMLAKFSFGIDPDEEDKERFDSVNNIFTPESDKIVVFTELDKNGNIKTNQDDYHFKVKVTGWGINAMETQSYLYKQLNEAGEWNNPSLSRNYWAVDPHYDYSEIYPKQFRQALDTLETVYYEEKFKDNINTNILRNYSYQALNNNLTSILYSPENTYNYSDNYKAWKEFYPTNRLHKLVGTHVVVCTEILTNMEKGGNDYRTGDFFCDRNGVWYKNEKDLFKAMIQILSNEFKSQQTMQYIYKDWGEKPETDCKPGDVIILDTRGEWFMYYDDTKITVDNYETIYNSLVDADNGCKATAKSYITNSDGQRILWFDHISIRDNDGNYIKRCLVKGVDNRGNQIIEPINDKYEGKMDHNHHKSMLYEWLGVIDHFREGRMYYAAPIMNVKNGPIENYGVVRNTWYKFTLKDINNLGTSVDDPLEPIVPNAVNKGYQLQLNIEILDWHELKTTLPW